MIVTLAYMGRSGVRNGGRRNVVSLAPNLARDPVAFDAPLRFPLRFREAISALHDVVISDLRFQPRDKTAYQLWKQGEQQRLEVLRRARFDLGKEEIMSRGDVPADLETNYNRLRTAYWKARNKYSNFLMHHDQELWRMLMPCDPVITIAKDVVFFECFSADESSYGCLTVNRGDGFGGSHGAQLGTTNVDYSWNLFNQFQSLRSYRQTRFNVDPSGFEVSTEGAEEFREEKIDLPQGWLRGFMQLQGAMGLPMRRVSLSREAVYSLLAWLRRHKAKESPRAIRFELADGVSPQMVLEPWGKTIVSHATKYHGPDTEPIRIWGRRRLQILARVLPLADRIDVHLLGTGLPSFWVVQMGEMRLTVGLSGWTTNDWTRGSALDLLSPPVTPSTELVDRLGSFVQTQGRAKRNQIESYGGTNPAESLAAMNHLAHSGQVIFDLDDDIYRWRQIMPQEVGERDMGPENHELAGSRKLVEQKRVEVHSTETTDKGETKHSGKVGNMPVAMSINADGRITRGKCFCGHHQRAGIRMGPCRHLLALREAAERANEVFATPEQTTEGWYNRIRAWLGGKPT